MTVDCAAVDFDLSTDQQALRDAAATLLDRMAGHDALRARVGAGAVVGTLPGAGAGDGDVRSPEGTAPGDVAADAPHGYDAGVWSAMADQGWLAIEVPADEGGLGLGMVELAVLCEEIGRRLVAAPFLPSVVALGALCSPEARGDAGTKEWREALSEGAAVGCVVFAPADGISVAQSGAGGDVRLSGRSTPTVYAPSADVAVVVTGGGVYAVDLRTEGCPGAVPAMDRTRELGILDFDGTPARSLGGADAAELLVDRAVTLVSAEMLGAADRVLSMTVEYAKDRVQFASPSARSRPSSTCWPTPWSTSRGCDRRCTTPRGVPRPVTAIVRCRRAWPRRGARTRRGGSWAPGCRSTAASASPGSTTCTST